MTAIKLEDSVGKRTNIESVARIVAESSGLEYNPKIQFSSLRELMVEDIDITDIFFKLGMPFQEYFNRAKDELTEKGKSILAEVTCELLLDGEYNEAGKLALIREINSLEGVRDYLNPFILSYIARYAETNNL